VATNGDDGEVARRLRPRLRRVWVLKCRNEPSLG